MEAEKGLWFATSTVECDPDSCLETFDTGTEKHDETDNYDSTHDAKNACLDCGLWTCDCEDQRCEACTAANADCTCKRCIRCRCLERLCLCDLCKDCNSPEHLCECNRCNECKRPESLCNCKRCRCCAIYIAECRCPSCMICYQDAHYCRCADPSVTRIKVEFDQHLLTHARLEALDPSSTVTWNWGQLQEQRKLILEGDFTHVIVFRNPFPVWKTAIKTKFADFIEQLSYTFQPTLRKAKLTIRRWALTPFEPEVEPTHINVRSKPSMHRLITRLASLPRNEPNISFDMECHNLGPHHAPCILTIRDETVP